MTGRNTGIDIRDKVIDLLQDSSSGFDNMISTINSERSHTAPSAKSITYQWGMNQYPYLMVDIDGSEGVTDEYILDMSYVNLPEIYTILVMGVMKYANDNIYNWCEDWIEAVIRVLHNYNSDDISWIIYVKTERAEIYDKQNQRLKSFVIEFEARSN